MGLIDIPPYVLAGDVPPHHKNPMRSFHLRTWEVPAPISFPRDLFADALAVHARLLEEHGAEMLDQPVIEGEPEYFLPNEIGLSCALLVSDGTAHEIHKWRRQEVSFVVQRCRGIVLQLMEDTPRDRMYVVVVAAGAASLNLARAHAPRRAGDRQRLEVLGLPLVVEPWEQWHRRTGGALVTTWRTPAGDAVASRVPLPPREWTVREIVDALARRYEASARKGIATYREEQHEGLPAVSLVTDVAGEEIVFVDCRELEAWVHEGLRGLARAARTAHPGFDPMFIDSHEWGALVWLPRAGEEIDAAPPAVRYAWNDEHEPCPGESVPDLYWVPHRGPPDGDHWWLRKRTPEELRGKLAERLARLVRLVDLRAPEVVVEEEKELVRNTIARLEPGDGDAVLRAWPRAARLLERGRKEQRKEEGRSRKGDGEKPN